MSKNYETSKGIGQLKYWKDHSKTFPKLAKITEKYFAVPASSAAVEQVLNIAGKICRPTQSRLKPATNSNVQYKHRKKNRNMAQIEL